MNQDRRTQELKEENRRIFYLRFLVDLALWEIRSGRRSLAEAQQIVDNVRAQALKLFPGKETAFEIIYQPRFRRAINETYRLH